MAKKKGGKKKGKSGQKRPQQDEVAPVPVGETAKIEDVPEETEVIQEDKEPALADAVSEVIGDKDDDDSGGGKVPKKFKTKLAKFTADGYDIAELENLIQNAGSKEMKELFNSFEDGIKAIEEMKRALEDMSLTGLDSEVESLTKLFSNPMKHEEASSAFEVLKFKQKAAELRIELDKMVLPSMKEKIESMKARLDNMDDWESIENDMIDLRAEYKESYFETGVKAEVVSEAPTAAAPGAPPAQKKRSPMIVKDIFLLYKDGRFISHHTNRVVSKEQQKLLFADLKTGRNFLRSPKYVPKKLNIIPVENRNILVQSGTFTVVIMIAEGTVDPWTERIVTKVLTLMEKEDALELKAWNGEVASLKSSGKYMQALLFACMKLSKKGKE